MASSRPATPEETEFGLVLFLCIGGFCLIGLAIWAIGKWMKKRD